MHRRTRSLAAVAALVLLSWWAPSTPVAATHTVTDQWIVVLDPGVDIVTQAPLIAASVGGSVGHVYSHVLGGFSFLGTSAQASLLWANPLVSGVAADRPVHLADASPAQLVPTGVSRVSAPAATAAGHNGDGVTVAVIDSGIDLVHPDLLDNIHPSLAANCIQPLLPPQDDNSHGTHVAGIIAAADNAIGVVGVAPAATLVPVKAFDASGDSDWATVICGIDYVAAHADEIDVVNMSFGDLSTDATDCDNKTTSVIDALRQSICDLTNAGVVAVAASGNNLIDTAGFVPAAFPEVITVSAFTDTDGAPGGLGGCIVFGALCDDSFASLFSNYGPRIDVMAPGFEILSTMPGGVYATKDGTSMASPHVAGAAALVLQAHPGLTTAEVRDALRRSGECPDGSVAGTDGGCVGQGLWALDPDGIAEPFLHAARAADLASDMAPTAAVAAPAANSTVAGTVTVGVAASDDRDAAGSLAVQVRVDSGTWQTATWNASTSRYQFSWNTRPVGNGSHSLQARATDSALHQTESAPVGVTVLNGMHVGDLDGAPVLSKRNWKAKVTVTVHSVSEALVSGATVSFAWGGGASGTGTCVTSRKGVCSATSGTIANSVAGATFTVTGVSASGQTYAGGLNHDPDGDSNGTTISVAR
jgi:hypothetical protein